MRLMIAALAGLAVAACALGPAPTALGGNAAAAAGEAEIDVTARDFYAWVNRMPPGPPSFHVTGELMLPHAGYDVSLAPSAPQGFNPAVLMLELTVTERDGPPPAANAPLGVRYDIEPYDAGARGYEEVSIVHAGEVIASVEVAVTY